MLHIKQVINKRQQKAFLDFPLKLYKGNPYFCPPIYLDEKKMFSKANVYSDQAKSIFFLAYQDDKVVGRIQGILQLVSNNKWNQKRIRFTRFDCINDKEVAKALFDAVEQWGKSLGMEYICGPLGYSDLDREGLLIKGFDQISTFEEQYNYEYYQSLIEHCGFEKDIDWLEFKLTPPDVDTDRMMRISSIMLKRSKLHVVKEKTTASFLKHYGQKLFDVIDETYSKLYGTVPFSLKMRKEIMANFKIFVDLRLTILIVDEQDNIVCFGICFPNITKALQKSMGHLTPAALIRLKKAMKNPDILDLGLIGVVPKYAKLGVSTHVLAKLLEYLKDHNIKHAETNLNLENNNHILIEWNNFGHENHKRRRSFIKKLI